MAQVGVTAGGSAASAPVLPSGPAPIDPEILKAAAQIRIGIVLDPTAPVAAQLRAALAAAAALQIASTAPVVAFKGAILVVMEALAMAGQQDVCKRLAAELDIVFGVSAALARQPLDLEAVLAALPDGRLPYGVLAIWADVSKKKI